MERWMARQIYCRVTGSKDIISSGGEIALLDRADSMEKNVCMPGAKYESVNGKFPIFPDVLSHLCKRKDILDVLLLLLLHFRCVMAKTDALKAP